MVDSPKWETNEARLGVSFDSYGPPHESETNTRKRSSVHFLTRHASAAGVRHVFSAHAMVARRESWHRMPSEHLRLPEISIGAQHKPRGSANDMSPISFFTSGECAQCQ